jgi:GT2 family glycosyltransferase
MNLSVIIVNWNTRERLRECLSSIETHLSGVDHEVLVVDNASSDGSTEMVAESFPDVRLIRNSENVGFGRANNQAMRVAEGRWFLLLNSDAALLDETVATLFARVQREERVGIAHFQAAPARSGGRSPDISEHRASARWRIAWMPSHTTYAAPTSVTTVYAVALAAITAPRPNATRRA